MYLKSAAELEALWGWHQVELGKHKLKALRGESKSNTSVQPLICIKDKVANYICKKKEGKEKQQLTEPQPATSRPIANPSAAEPWPLPASINPFPPYVLVWVCSIHSIL